MQIKVLGFSWEAGTPITAAVLVNKLIAQSGRTFSAGALDRIAYWKRLSSPKGFVGAMLITIKDHRRYFELQRSGAALKIVAQEVEEGRQMAEVNFMILNPATGRGMMTYYHGSWSVGAICHWVAVEHGKLRAEKIEQAAAREKTAAAQRKARGQARKNYDRMDWAHLLTQKALKEMIKEMKRVKAFSFDVAAVISKRSSRFRSLMPGHVRRQTERFVFKKGAGTWAKLVDLAAKQIPKFVKTQGIEKGKVEGVDADGDRAVVNIVSNLQVYDYRDYDEAMDGLEVEPNSFTKLDLFAWLTEEVKRNRAAL